MGLGFGFGFERSAHVRVLREVLRHHRGAEALLGVGVGVGVGAGAGVGAGVG